MELRVGASAPSLVVRGLVGSLGTAAHAGQPLVMAFAPRAGSLAPARARRLRAELRGLGAALVLITDNEVSAFHADDAPEVHARAAELPVGAIDDLRARFGIASTGAPDRAAHAAAAGPIAVVVLDGDRKVRFAREAAIVDGSASPLDLVVDALGDAGRALVAGDEAACERACPQRGVTRRELLVTSLVSAFALALVEACKPKDAPGRGGALGTTSLTAASSMDVDVTLDVNGQSHALKLDPRTSLLDALRETLHLTGTKKGCDHGQCGACTVLVDGRRVNACLTLAVMAQGAHVTTIEGLARGDELHPVQAAFLEEDAFQCGYCTPGQIMSAVALLAEGHAASDDDVREQMSGNLCRCGAYPNIVAAIRRAKGEGTP